MRDDYRVIRAPHLAGRAGLRELRGERRPARRLRAAAPAAGHPDVPDRVGPGRVHRLADRAAAGAPTGTWCCRPCAAMISSTPRSTGSTTATAASRAAAGWSSCTPTTSPTLGLANGEHGRPDRRTGPTTTVERRATASGSSPTTPRAAARRPTTRRRTRWCRWTPPPSGSNTPTSKSVIISLVPAGSAANETTRRSRPMDVTAPTSAQEPSPEPHHLLLNPLGAGCGAE